jgi:hypothetical protein
MVFNRTLLPRFAKMNVEPLPAMHLPTKARESWLVHCGGPVSADVVDVAEALGGGVHGAPFALSVPPVQDASSDSVCCVVEAEPTVTVFVPPPQPEKAAATSSRGISFRRSTAQPPLPSRHRVETLFPGVMKV